MDYFKYWFSSSEYISVKKELKTFKAELTDLGSKPLSSEERVRYRDRYKRIVDAITNEKLSSKEKNKLSEALRTFRLRFGNHGFIDDMETSATTSDSTLGAKEHNLRFPARTNDTARSNQGSKNSRPMKATFRSKNQLTPDNVYKDQNVKDLRQEKSETVHMSVTSYGTWGQPAVRHGSRQENSEAVGTSVNLYGSWTQPSVQQKVPICSLPNSYPKTTNINYEKKGYENLPQVHSHGTNAQNRSTNENYGLLRAVGNRQKSISETSWAEHQVDVSNGKEKCDEKMDYDCSISNPPKNQRRSSASLHMNLSSDELRTLTIIQQQNLQTSSSSTRSLRSQYSSHDSNANANEQRRSFAELEDKHRQAELSRQYPPEADTGARGEKYRKEEPLKPSREEYNVPNPGTSNKKHQVDGSFPNSEDNCSEKMDFESSFSSASGSRSEDFNHSSSSIELLKKSSYDSRRRNQVDGSVSSPKAKCADKMEFESSSSSQSGSRSEDFNHSSSSIELLKNSSRSHFTGERRNQVDSSVSSPKAKCAEKMDYQSSFSQASVSRRRSGDYDYSAKDEKRSYSTETKSRKRADAIDRDGKRRENTAERISRSVQSSCGRHRDITDVKENYGKVPQRTETRGKAKYINLKKLDGTVERKKLVGNFAENDTFVEQLNGSYKKTNRILGYGESSSAQSLLDPRNKYGIVDDRTSIVEQHRDDSNHSTGGWTNQESPPEPEEKPLQVVDVAQYFTDELDLNSLDSLDFTERIDKIHTYAKSFEPKINVFNEEKYSLGYFVFDEKLMRLIEKLDKMKCQQDEQLTMKKVEVIQYIKNLQQTLDQRAKDD